MPSDPPAMRRLLRGLLPLGISLVACAPSVVLRTHPPPKPHPTLAVAVYPFELPWDLDSPQTLLLADRLALRVARTQAYAVFGPNDLSLTTASQVKFPLPADWPLTQRLPGLLSDGLAVLHGWGEWHLGDGTGASSQSRGQSQTQPAVPVSGRGGGRSRGQGPLPDRPGDSNSYVAHLELLDATGRVLADAESDPTSSSDLGSQVDALAEKMVAAMAQVSPGTPDPRHPWWEDESLTIAGPRIQAPSPAAMEAGLREGDVIVKVGSSPATDLSILREQHLAPAGTTVPVVIHRAGAELILNLPTSG